MLYMTWLSHICRGEQQQVQSVKLGPLQVDALAADESEPANRVAVVEVAAARPLSGSQAFGNATGNALALAKFLGLFRLDSPADADSDAACNCSPPAVAANTTAVAEDKYGELYLALCVVVKVRHGPSPIVSYM